MSLVKKKFKSKFERLLEKLQGKSSKGAKYRKKKETLTNKNLRKIIAQNEAEKKTIESD